MDPRTFALSDRPLGFALCRLAADGKTQEYRDPLDGAAAWGPFDPAMVRPLNRGPGINLAVQAAAYVEPGAGCVAVLYTLDAAGKPVKPASLAPGQPEGPGDSYAFCTFNGAAR